MRSWPAGRVLPDQIEPAVGPAVAADEKGFLQRCAWCSYYAGLLTVNEMKTIQESYTLSFCKIRAILQFQGKILLTRIEMA